MAKPDWQEVSKTYTSLVTEESRVPKTEVESALWVAAVMTEVVRGDPGAAGTAGLIARGILILDATGDAMVLGNKNMQELAVWSGDGRVAGSEAQVDHRKGKVTVGKQIFEIQETSDRSRLLLPGQTENSHNHVGIAMMQTVLATKRTEGLFAGVLSEEGKSEDNVQIIELAQNVLMWANELGRGSGEVRVKNGLQMIYEGLMGRQEFN
jgi:hypothetical protein